MGNRPGTLEALGSPLQRPTRTEVRLWRGKAPNWKKIKAEYIRGGISQQKLAEKYGISYNTLRNHARKERWGELRNETDQKVTQNLPQKIADSQVTILVELSGFQDEATVALYKKLLEIIEAYPAGTGTRITRDMQCRAVIASGKTYPVKAVCGRESFSGILQAMLEIDGPYILPIGDCETIAYPR